MISPVEPSESLDSVADVVPDVDQVVDAVGKNVSEAFPKADIADNDADEPVDLDITPLAPHIVSPPNDVSPLAVEPQRRSSIRKEWSRRVSTPILQSSHAKSSEPSAVGYFRRLLEEETKRLGILTDEWSDYKEQHHAELTSKFELLNTMYDD